MSFPFRQIPLDGAKAPEVFASSRCISMAFRLALALACAVLLGALLAAPAAPAYAGYDAAADEYPATQELGTFGDVIYGSEVPDGTYSVIARTTSRMCVLYETNGDAEASVNRERCFVQVSGGQMVAAFYISKAYTRLYMGPAEEAAALANGNPTYDAPAYLVGEPAEGYTPHRFVIAIPALNSPMTMSVFAGGNYEITNPRAMWYTRQVVFIPGADMLRAIEDARSGGGGEQEQAEGDANDDANQQQPQADEGAQSNAVAGGANNAAAGGGDDNQANQQNGQDPEQGSGTSESTSAQSQSRHGILISPTNLADQDFEAVEEEEPEEEEEQVMVIPPELLVTIGLLVLVGGGMAARVVLFRRGLRVPVTVRTRPAEVVS